MRHSFEKTIRRKRRYWACPIGFLLFHLCMARGENATSCPSICFCDESAQYVSCVGEGLWEMPVNIPRTAVRLELRNFVVPSLAVGDLEGLAELQELKLQQTEIKVVENGTFAQLVKLVRLDLNQNLLENLTAATFVGLHNLRYLDVSSNSLLHIEESFQDLALVEQLNLRGNRISHLTDASFRGLLKVQYLNLDYNAVESIEMGSFQKLANLAHLILSNNPLRVLSRLDFFGSRLQYIDVSNIGLERVPPSLTRFVRDLRLAKNNISRIAAGDFDSYPYLGLLVLDDNLIAEIENDALGRQEYLFRLWLNGNRLARVPGNLPTSLRALYMEENQLELIHPYSFRGLVKLEQLFLQRNRITSLSICAFCDLVELKNLDLQANLIHELFEGMFTNLTKLETLDLSQNNLKVLGPRCMLGMESLRTLQMSRMSNEMTFDDSLFDPLKSLSVLEMYDSAEFAWHVVNSTRILHGLRHLQQLNIMHNKLTSLRSDFPSFFPQLKVIKMSGNLWTCGPGIQWLSSWIKSTSVQFYRSYSIRCASPERLQYKPIMLLSDYDLREVVTSTFQSTVRETMTELTTPIAPETSSIVDPTTQLVLTDMPINTTPLVDLQLEMKNTVQTTTSTSTTPTTVIPNETISTNNEEMLIRTVAILATENIARSIKTEVILDDTTLPDEDENNTKSWALRYKYRNRTASQLQRFYISPVDSEHTEKHWDRITAVTVSTSLAGGCLLILTGMILFFSIHRWRHKSLRNSSERSLRRSSSISYHPQRDEVSIMTVSEGTVGWKTSTHHGLGNKLYYALEDVDIVGENTRKTSSLLSAPL